MSDLPDSIVEAIAISNAKSIGEQPAILANMQLANQVFNNNLAQQATIQGQQVLGILTAAILAKCTALLLSHSGDATEDNTARIQHLVELMQSLQPTATIPNSAFQPLDIKDPTKGGVADTESKTTKAKDSAAGTKKPRKTSRTKKL